MRPTSFVSPRDERRPEGPALLWATHGSETTYMPPDVHVHRGLELGILLGGREALHFSDSILECGPGDVWLCNVFEPHGASLRAAPRRSIVLIFVPEFIGDEMVGGLPWLALFGVPPDERPRAASPEMRARALAIAEVLRREIDQKPAYWEDVVRLQVLHLLTALRREWDTPPNASALGTGGVGRLAQLMPALSLVHSLPWRRVPVQEAAAACRLSVSTFHALFRQTMGLSFARFGLRARLAFAANQLLNTAHPSSAIAAESGFTDRSHLYRRFLEQYGCSPEVYRRRAHSMAARPMGAGSPGAD